MTIVLESRYMALTVTPVASQESDESEIKLILPCDKAGRRLEDVDWSVLGAATAATATELVTAPGPGPVGQLRKRRAMARWGDGEIGKGLTRDGEMGKMIVEYQATWGSFGKILDEETEMEMSFWFVCWQSNTGRLLFLVESFWWKWSLGEFGIYPVVHHTWQWKIRHVWWWFSELKTYILDQIRAFLIIFPHVWWYVRVSTNVPRGDEI